MTKSPLIRPIGYSNFGCGTPSFKFSIFSGETLLFRLTQRRYTKDDILTLDDVLIKINKLYYIIRPFKEDSVLNSPRNHPPNELDFNAEKYFNTIEYFNNCHYHNGGVIIYTPFETDRSKH